MPSITELQAALNRLRNNPRVSLIRVSVADEACPACQALQGAYAKDVVPALPAEGCSCPNGRPAVFYDPVLEEIYP
ncbi:MAG TPA: hypothetical protein PLC98_24320 [Anaerolineales bacterium]|nr:hypothetical protein [Anaerolineales bacterium]